MEFVRLCPACHSERPVQEMYCQNTVDDTGCSWLLMNVTQTPKGGKIEIEESPIVKNARHCTNGHEVQAGDFMCMECGADIEVLPTPEKIAKAQQIDEYQIIKSVKAERTTKECFLVKDAADKEYFLTLYFENSEPDKSIYKVLEKMDTDHIATLIKTGDYNGRFFEVSELISDGSLDTLGYLPIDKIEKLVNEVGRAIHKLSEAGIRHRDICPKNLLLRDSASFDVVIIDYSSARLSDYDLDTDTPIELTRYTAPEAIIGGISPASDWWSLGMIVLDHITKGTFFEKINDKAFMIHLITRGVDIPSSIDARILLLLKGLLTRDPLKRWNWEQVDKWLKKEEVEVPVEQISTSTKKEKKITLGSADYTNVAFFALAAAEEEHWEEGVSLFNSGSLASWVTEVFGNDKKAAAVRNLRNKEDIPLEWCYPLALMVLNEALPLTWRGQIIIPAWLMGNTKEAIKLVEGHVPDYLASLQREKWLIQLKERKANIARKAKNLDIQLDNDKFLIYSLSSSRVKLKSELDFLRRLYPDAHNPGLSDVMSNLRLTEEDMILVLSARRNQFITLEELLSKTEKLAKKNGLEPNLPFYKDSLVKYRLEIFEMLNNHLEGFSRCNNAALDRWADRFRIEKRLPIIPSVLCLSIPKNKWVAPPKHEYGSSLLRHFEKKVVYASSRGPLVRLIISKHSSRIDLSELGTSLKSSEKLVHSILKRSTGTENVDPLAFNTKALLAQRIRRMLLKADNFKRDTGLDSLFMGFPFLIAQHKMTHRPRIMPILLWPVNLDFSSRGATTLKFSFDYAHGEIRLNPALVNTLDPDNYKKLEKITREILGRQSLHVSEVIDAFSACFPAHTNELTAHPSVNFKRDEIGTELHASAVFFNANFTGQAISEDLRLLQKLPHSGSSMEPILKISEPEINSTIEISPENGRYTTMAIDPSQDNAVLKSRSSPGIVIEGPPGTGKSQTIVNIISDCIGRNEKVLVISQKRAAIQVILKRLQAVGLEKRALLITDLSRDRQPIIQGIREQVAHYYSQPNNQRTLDNLVQKREDLGKKIDRIETNLDVLSHQIHLVDDTSGLSYRNILSELIDITSKEYVEVPELRLLFENSTKNKLNILSEEISNLITDWVPSKYEGNHLKNLQITSFDHTTETALNKDLNEFYETEKERVQFIKETSGKLDTPNAAHYNQYLAIHKETLLNVSKSQATKNQLWLNLLYDKFDNQSIGDDIHDNLVKLLEQVEQLISNYQDNRFAVYFDTLDDEKVLKLNKACATYLGTSSFKKINPFYWINKSQLKKVVTEHHLQLNEKVVSELHSAVLLENNFRAYRKEYAQHLLKLKTRYVMVKEPRRLAVDIKSTIRELAQAISLVSVLRSCPAKDEARTILETGDENAYKDFSIALESASRRFQNRQQSLSKLNVLEKWLTPHSVTTFTNAVEQNNTDLDTVASIISDMVNFVAYQKFRIRFQNSTAQDELIEIFAILRKYEHEISNFPIENWSDLISISLHREGLLAWKQRIEKSYPSMLMAEREVLQQISDLEENLNSMKTLNRNILALNYNFENIESQTAWNSITRLRGKNYKKLREFISEGEPLGLLELRPVWLMNPEVVSQALPLQSGMFDVIIFDEASQMLVDHAIPSLYRGKRVIISGDEKQMPPTGFFTKKLEEDDDDTDQTELDEDHSEEELVNYEDAWNKKEVKDSPDLLSLAKTVLPTTTLQIHYRSKYKALINYSNYAFYDGMLHIPAYHPKEEISVVKPIEVLRVNGIYDEQTNTAEADTLIAYLAEHWALPEHERLSTGIVTFNKKQAELIEDTIEQHAAQDDTFGRALTIARNKEQDGEDMGFFVKNVENVQGDERDMILFSTTFGINPLGSFRRNFGALGHRGGERRLNVAITRARNKVVIATSMPTQAISDILSTGRLASKPRDYIQTYLNYAEIHSNNQIAMATNTLRLLSTSDHQQIAKIRNDGFKNIVKAYVESLGYETVEDSDNSVFYMDLAIKDKQQGQFILGIECDAPYNNLLKQARYRELWRPKVLKRSIPHIHRTTSYQWLQNTHEEQLKLKNAIEMALIQD
ncbi:superfamily I DNA and/or RNA helicase [Maribacter caenipelagi]|uniref:Superfamily I DNA and/or RNA helicase n=1 Tax=Maribacter caenipelagi TaxID=1447781 RepID=A0A4V3E1P5_9FLAO|nr:AAA domain-containing protein [Maribacter caenipelagi]TDS14198.1 superfamily I DNA and/or RNA helicase [Maribacter caenipelagi]